jgi:hypothetical protein
MTRPTIFTSFSGEYAGYTMSAEEYDLDGYEPRSMAFHGSTTGERLIRDLESRRRRSNSTGR